MYKILRTSDFEPFQVDGVWCRPIAREDYFFVPDGWQEHLTDRGIEFTELETDGTE